MLNPTSIGFLNATARAVHGSPTLLRHVPQSFLSSSTLLTFTSQLQSVGLSNSTASDAIVTSSISKSILTVFISLMSLTTVLGNALVITAFIREPTIRTYSNYFILNLSIADLFIGLIWLVRPLSRAYRLRRAENGSGESFIVSSFQLLRMLQRAFLRS